MNIECFTNAYEVKCTSTEKALYKLYDQPITQAEADSLIEGIGKAFMKNLKEYLDPKEE